MSKSISKAQQEKVKEAIEKGVRSMIRAQLALPMNKRTGFLRKRFKDGGSFL